MQRWLAKSTLKVACPDPAFEAVNTQGPLTRRSIGINDCREYEWPYNPAGEDTKHETQRNKQNKLPIWTNTVQLVMFDTTKSRVEIPKPKCLSRMKVSPIVLTGLKATNKPISLVVTI
jgi:hypothetical protein